MEKCKTVMNRVLNGEKSPELDAHLQECSQCKVLADLEHIVLEIKSAKKIEVPLSLDQKILAYAKQKSESRHKTWNFSRLLKKYAFPAAAAVIVFGITFTTWHEQNSKQEITAKLASDTFFNNNEDMTSELMLISSAIQQSSEVLDRTIAYNNTFDKGY